MDYEDSNLHFLEKVVDGVRKKGLNDEGDKVI